MAPEQTVDDYDAMPSDVTLVPLIPATLPSPTNELQLGEGYVTSDSIMRVENFMLRARTNHRCFFIALSFFNSGVFFDTMDNGVNRAMVRCPVYSSI